MIVHHYRTLNLCRLLIHAVRQGGLATKMDKASLADPVISRFVKYRPACSLLSFLTAKRDKAHVPSKPSRQGGQASATITAELIQCQS